MDEVLGVIAAFGISAQILFVAQKKAEQLGVTAGDGGLLSTSSPSGTSPKSQCFL